MSRNEKESIASTSNPQSGSFAYQTRILENSLSRAPSLSRSGCVRKGIVSLSSSRKLTYTHRSGSSVDSLRLERSRPIAENTIVADVGRPISTSEDAFGDKGLPDTARHSSILSREAPLTLDIPTPLFKQAAPDLVRPQQAGTGRSPSKSSTNEFMGGSGRSFATLSHLNSEELPLRPSLRTLDNDTGSWSPSTTTPDSRRHRVTGSIDSIRTKWEARAREAEKAEVPTQTTGPLQRSGTTSKPVPQEAQRRPLEVSTLPTPSRTHEIPDRFEASTPVALKRRTMPDLLAVTSIRDKWESRSRGQDDVSELGQLPASVKLDVAPNSSIAVDDTASLHRGPTTRRNALVDSVSTSGPSSLNASTSMTSPAVVHRVNSPVTRPLQTSLTPTSRERADSTSQSSSTPADSSSTIGSRARRSLSVDSTGTFSADSRTNQLASGGRNIEPKSSPSPSSGAIKQDNYAGLGTRRRLGNHLPRIASGDAADHWPSPSPSSPSPAHSSKNNRLH